MSKVKVVIILAIGLISAIGFAFPSVKAQGLSVREGQFRAPDESETGAAMSGRLATAVRSDQTSEYMIGRVAVSLVLIESDGSLEPDQTNWTATQRQRVLDEVQAGLNWWADRQPEAHLSFAIEDHATTPIPSGYEPINHSQSAEGLWIGDVLTRLGYSTGGYFSRMRTYANELRTRHHVDWAFTILVVNSSGDADGAFSDGYFAYAYIGGPFLVVTYDNGGYGIDHMDAVVTHEIGHIFRALDQYSSANIPCTFASGYLGIENQNSQYAGCTSNVSSIMRGGIAPYLSAAIDSSAAGQIGWLDGDADGILDPIDTEPILTVTAVVQSDAGWTYIGNARDLPYPSLTRPALSINTVSAEYQLDQGDWLTISTTEPNLLDGGTAFTLTLTNLPPGNHRLNLRAHNSVGHVSSTVTNLLIVPDPIDGGLDTWLAADSLAGMTCRSGFPIVGEATSYLSGGAAGPNIVRIEVQLDDGVWQLAQAADGEFDSTTESFAFNAQLTPGSHTIKARATDANAKIEQHPATLAVTIAEQHCSYAPLIVR